MRILLALASLALLAGCTTTQGPTPDAPVAIPALPTSLAAPCAAPVTLPVAATNQQDTERFWATDRTNLKICAGRQAAGVESYDAVRTQLAGAAK
jgi:hypothetical protein